MAMLAFLLAAFLLALPFRYAGNGEIFSGILTLFAFIGLILILPGMALGALLGARTYRVERRQGTRAGVGIGAVAGLTSYLIFFTLFANMPLLVVPLIASASLLLYALFATGRNLEYRRRVVLLAAGIAVLSGAGALLLSFDLLGLLGALFSVAAAAAGGFVGGAGYARAGGDEMIPPGSTIRRREPRRKPQ
jgi:drug/metabolite transporter (DMT)-like permease